MDNCLDRQDALIKKFQNCSESQDIYEKIIQLGKGVEKVEEIYKREANRVLGCQSITYLHAYMNSDKMYFTIDSDALISAGLGALLIEIYNGEKPETILKCPPKCINELGILDAVTPSRANGLSSMYQELKKRALMFLVEKEKSKS